MKGNEKKPEDEFETNPSKKQELFRLIDEYNNTVFNTAEEKEIVAHLMEILNLKSELHEQEVDLSDLPHIKTKGAENQEEN